MSTQRASQQAAITAVASCLPDEIVPNSFFESYLDTSDEWIVERTGIRERRVVEKGQATSDLGAAAAKRLLEKRGIDAREQLFVVEQQRFVVVRRRRWIEQRRRGLGQLVGAARRRYCGPPQKGTSPARPSVKRVATRVAADGLRCAGQVVSIHV